MRKQLLILGLLFAPVFALAQSACEVSVTGSAKLAGSSAKFCTTAVLLQSIAVSPQSQTVVQGNSGTFTATGTFNDGSQSDVTSLANWTSSDLTIATVGLANNPQPFGCVLTNSGTVTVTATVGAISGTATLNCVPAPTITTSSLPSATVGAPYNANLNASSGTLPYSWAITSGTLPSGLSLNSASPTATITGTPTVAGISVFTVTVTDAASHSGSKLFTINVASGATSQTPVLPQRWANARECYESSPGTPITFNNTFLLTSSWSCHGTSKGPYANSLAGLNSAIVDTEACRTSFNDSSHIMVPHGSLWSQNIGTLGYVNLKQTSGDNSSSCIWISSDNPLPDADPATGLPRDQMFGTYNIASSNGDVCSTSNGTTVCTVTFMNPAAVAPAVGDLASLWNTDDHNYTGQFTVCGPPTCSSPSTTGFQYIQPEDLMSWVVANFSTRTTKHLTGGSNPNYGFVDTDGQKFWEIKSATGNPWDLNLYDYRGIYHYITEDGDTVDQATCQANGFSSCFVDPNAYKRQTTPGGVQVMPRFFIPGSTITIDTPGPNTFIRTTNCELPGTTASVNLGPVHTVTSGPTMINWGGSIGLAPTIENDYEYTLSNGVYQNKEVFQYVKNHGLMSWTLYAWNGTTYVQQQQNTHTTESAGGAPLPNFPCFGQTPNWVGGQPGLGGNANLPLVPAIGSGTQNGVVMSLQRQDAIQQIAASGCGTTGAVCTLTIDFASNPNFAANDRFEIVDSVCSGCITLDPNAFNTTWYVASVTSNTNCATCRITVNTYTEAFGNTATASNGTALHFNHIIADQTANNLWTIQTTGGSGDIVFGDTNNFHNYFLSDAELRTASTNTAVTFVAVQLSPNGEAQTPVPAMSVANCNGTPGVTNCDNPSHVYLDHVYIHGYSFPTVARTASGIGIGVKLDCSYCGVTNSRISDVHQDGAESHGISGNSGAGPFKIVDNYIEGTAENIFFSYLPVVSGLPNGYYCDFEIRRNWLSKNPFESMNSGGFIPGGTGRYFQYLEKNNMEFKNVCQALIRGNVFQNSSGGAGEQQGFLLGNNETPNNGNGKAFHIGAQSHDVTFVNNIFRHAFGLAYIPTRSQLVTTDSPSYGTHHYMFFGNLIYDIGDPTRFGRNCWTGTAWGGGVGAQSGCTHEDIIQIANRGQSYNCTGTQTAGLATMSCTPVSPSCVASLEGGGGPCGVGFQVGDWVNVTGCSDATWDVSAPAQVPSLTSDPLLSSGTFQYTVPLTAAASVTGCVVNNANGWARNITWQHNSAFVDYTNTNPYYSSVPFTRFRVFGNDNSNNIAMIRDWWIKDNVFSIQTPQVTSGNQGFFWCAPNQTEETSAEQTCWDPLTLVWTHNVVAAPGLPYETPQLWTEYNSPFGVAGANNGVSPPVTNLMGLAFNCHQAFSTGCMGLAGDYLLIGCGTLGCGKANNVPDFASSARDYHIFALNPSSFFASGGANHASDNTDLGSSITQIDQALGEQQYTCPTTCGMSGGPYP